MTDTTDITALRAESANLMILLHKEGLGGEVTLTAAKFFDDVFRLLEAEHQRNDESEAGFWGRACARETQRANTAEVAAKSYKNTAEVACKEIAALKSKLDNPVVLKPAYTQSDYNLLGLETCDAYGLAWGSSATRDDAVKQIREAGFTVKGE